MKKEVSVNFNKDKPEAFGEIYDYFYSKIFGYVYRRIGDYDIARDITAETFLKAFMNIRKYGFEGDNIASWLYKIATNEMNLFFRSLRYSPDLFSRFSTDLIDDEVLHSIFEKEKAELERQQQEYDEFRQIQEQLKKLELKYQEVIALRFFEDKAIKEISEILGKPEGTIKSLLSRGVEKLRDKLV
ncbi:RNA polymerase sigma factor [Emticicia sp. BO119]|uniref:RNA polymerase sigma factor n=1 Tax=Emticicia sp. BO119 TaxID=2757768 RepID=UPI0015F1077E|nr:RNA polymerase sigma factor [Emticicia sp. BO119]MBA4851669.1 RNA polymerase sigma factor [Emticicia sp. BO119]